MTDKQTSKMRHKEILNPKTWFRSRSSPQPSTSGQDIRTSSVRHAIVSTGNLFAAPIWHVAHLSRLQSASSSHSVSGSTAPHDYASTHDNMDSVIINQPHGSVNNLSESQAPSDTSTGRATAKDVAGVAWSFTEMLLKKLPATVDTNPTKIALGIVKTVLEIKAEVKGNVDTVERRILSTVDQLRAVTEALDGWRPNNIVETQGVELYERTLKVEWNNLLDLKKQSLFRKIAVHEEDKGRIADIFERINQAREQLVVVTSIRIHKIVHAIQEDIARLLLEKLEASHIADYKSELEEEQKQLLRRTVCTPGTRVRILNDIVKWANDTSSESHSVYWLSGQVGSGKSTIAYTIARRFDLATDADDTLVLGGNFFCSRQLNETRSAIRIVRTIVYHLALRSKPFAEALNRSGNLHTIYQNARFQLQSLLIEPWEQAHLADRSKMPRFLVVIDALDEIEGQGGSEFLRDLLDSISKHSLPGLKFFATSRPDPKLVKHLQGFQRKQVYRLEQVPIEEGQADIRAYLHVNLPKLIHHPKMEKLVTQAAGLFIYAATVVKYLNGCTPVEQVERLEALLSALDSAMSRDTEGEEEDGTPLELDALYLQILTDSFRPFKREQLNRRLLILHTFLCTAERTSTSVAVQLLFPHVEIATDPKHRYTEIADDVLTSLHAVLYTENDTVFTYHKSFTDFMFNQKRSKDFWCDRANHHHRLAKSCFHIMDRLKFNIANIKSSFLFDRQNHALPESIKNNIPPVLSYCCRHWDYHLLAAVPTALDPLLDTLSEFIQLRALFWIETMNLLGVRGMCDQMLDRAYKWVPKDASELKDELAEAALFALYFSGSEAALSTPHLYISSLSTWPRNMRPLQGWKSHFSGIPGFTNSLIVSGLLMTLNVGSRVNSAAFSSDNRHIVSGSDDGLVRVWDASTGDMLKELEGHTDVVRSVAFSSDDKHILSGSHDGSVRLWNTSTGEVLKVLEGHINYVNSAAFSSDDRHIVSGSSDCSVRLWDTSTGETLKVLEGHTDGIRAVAFSNNNRHIVSGSENGLVCVWDTSTGNMLKELEGHTEVVQSVAFSSNDRRIVSGSNDKSVRVWDISTGEILKVLEGHIYAVASVAFSSDDKHIVSGSHDNSVRVWDTSTGEMMMVLEGHRSLVTSVAFSSDDRHIVSGSMDKSVRVWDASTGDMLKVLNGQTDVVPSATFLSDNDRHILSGSHDRSVQLQDTSTGEMLKVLEGHTNYVSSVAYSSDDRLIVSGSWDSSVRIWDISTGKTLRVLKGHTGEVNTIALSSDNKHIVSGSHDKSVRVWDTSTGEMLKVLEGHTNLVLSVAFSRDDRYLVSGSMDKSVRVWDTFLDGTLTVLEGHTDFVWSVKFSSDDKYIASGSEDRSVRVWDTSTGKMLKVLEGHTDFVLSVAYSSNDRHIASGSGDNSVRIWDIFTSEILQVLEGHTSTVSSTAFSRDGRHIFSCSFDNSIRVWNTSTGETLKVLDGHANAVSSTAFSSAGEYIISGSWDKSVRVWDVSKAGMLKIIEGRTDSGGGGSTDLSSVPPLALPEHHTSLEYIQEKELDQDGHARRTGWLLSEHGEPLMYVPISAGLPDPANILTLPPSYAASVNFANATLGPDWYKCFSPQARV